MKSQLPNRQRIYFSSVMKLLSVSSLIKTNKRRNTHRTVIQPFVNQQRFIKAALLVGVALLSLVVIAHAQSTGITVIVNTLGDAADFNEFDGVCDSDPNTPGGQCTFRAAIQYHNSNRNLPKNRIRFEIANAPGTGSIVINVGSTGLGALPPILGAVDVSGSNQDSRRIELDGTNAGAGAIGLNVLGEACDISSFVINNFGSHGMHFSGTQFSNGDHTIKFMVIGTDESVTIDKGNGGDGIFVEDVPNNTIGGANILEGNVVAGNAGYGIHILGRDPNVTGFPLSGAPGNKLFSNSIGVDKIASTVIPNDLGGIFIDNAREILVGEEAGGVVGQQTPPGKGNIISGVKEGIRVTGSLSKGVRVEANSIFAKDEAVAKLLVGIFARPGELFSATGNIITNVGDASLDLFFDANSKYVVKKNVLESILKAGAIIKFAENRIITVEYRNNNHLGIVGGRTSGIGLEIEESVRSTIHWVLDSNSATNCKTGAKITLRSSGEKNFTNNTWQFNTGLGIEYINEFAQGAVAKLTINNETSIGNSGEGFFLRTQLDATADVTINMMKLVGSNNGKDGLSLALRATAGAKAIINVGGQTELSANASLALRIIGEKSSIDVFKVDVSKTTAKDNIEGAFYLFDVKLKFSVTENAILGNGGPAIRLGGASEARIDGNTLSDNSIGVLTEDEAIATISNNIITANGKGVVLGGAVVGVPLFTNSIFGNLEFGIDLGGDGVTLNDLGDGDIGPNNLQNFPVLSSVSSAGGNTTINGSLNSTPNTTFRVEFFSNKTCNSSGFGEGETFIGFSMVSTDAAGNVSFTSQLSGVSLNLGSFITATATDAALNTSEFSACKQFGTAQSADLELTKQADKTKLAKGEQVAFTITITNRGPDAATGIVVKDILPAGLKFSQATASSGSYDNASGAWSITALNANTQATLSLSATAEQTGTLTNTAEIVKSDQADPDSAPNNNQTGEDDQSSTTLEITDVATDPAQQIQQLITEVNSLVSSELLSDKDGNKLTKQLENALSQLNKGNSKSTINQLELFIKTVEGLMKKGQLSNSEGEALIAAAQSIIQQLHTDLKQSMRTLKNSESAQRQVGLRLYTVYPSPFKVSTTISFELVNQSKAHVVIYDQGGRLVTSLLNEVVSAGRHDIVWKANDLPAGIYLVQLRINDRVTIKRVVLAK